MCISFQLIMEYKSLGTLEESPRQLHTIRINFEDNLDVQYASERVVFDIAVLSLCVRPIAILGIHELLSTSVNQSQLRLQT